MRKEVVTRIEEVAKVFAEFNWKTVALDTETTDLRYDKLEMTTITLYDGKIGIYIEMNPGTIEYVKTYFKAFVNKPENVIICHNIIFDMKVLHKYGINLRECEWFDTLVAIHLLDENRMDNKLKTLAKEFLGKEVVTYDQLKGIKDYSNSQFVDYAINDTVYTYGLAHLFKPLLVEQGLTPLFREIEMPFQRPLLDIELNGILVDRERLQKITTDMIQQKMDVETEIYEKLNIKYLLQCDLFGGMTIVSTINLDSSADLAKILFEDLKLECVERSEKTGKPSVGKFTLENLKGKHEVVDLIIKHKVLSKLLSSFSIDSITPFIDSDGRVRSNYRDTGTVTGRLSCNTPNLQQLPKDRKDIGISVRQVFIASEGKKLISCDYSGQEIRVLAEVTKDPTLVNALNNGWDLHLATANTFFNLGIPEEALVETHPDFDKYKKKFKEERGKAKTITFGLAYGKSGFGFAKDFKITEEEGNAILTKYFSQFPKVKEAMDRCNKELDKSDNVTQLFGRKRRFIKMENKGWVGHIRKSYRQSFNFLIQSPSADMIRLACTKVYNISKLHPEWDLKIIATIHDEGLWESSEKYVSEASLAIKEAFESVVNFDVKMLAETGVGDNYGSCK